ncbi:MAG: NAD-dependent epimerase/dehydratase family protein [Pseudomonadota bacterium]
MRSYNSSNPLHVAVTGANGFIGREVVRQAAAQSDWMFTRIVRHITERDAFLPAVDRTRACGDIGPETNWLRTLRNVDVVIHTAARAHVLEEKNADPAAAFHATNVAGTRRLAEDASRAGVRRLIFLSTIGVHGDVTGPERNDALTEESPIAPHTPYAASKRDAEIALHTHAAATSLETTILRLPLVYGASDAGDGRDIPGNLARLLKAVERGVPLPLASLDNRRSLLSRAALADLAIRCVTDPAAENATYLAADNDAISTSSLVRAIAAANGNTARMFPVPASLLQTICVALGRGAIARQLTGSLRVNAAKARKELDWQPPTDTAAAVVHALAKRRVPVDDPTSKRQ